MNSSIVKLVGTVIFGICLGLAVSAFGIDDQFVVPAFGLWLAGWLCCYLGTDSTVDRYYQGPTRIQDRFAELLSCLTLVCPLACAAMTYAECQRFAAITLPLFFFMISLLTFWEVQGVLKKQKAWQAI